MAKTTKKNAVKVNKEKRENRHDAGLVAGLGERRLPCKWCVNHRIHHNLAGHKNCERREKCRCEKCAPLTEKAAKRKETDLKAREKKEMERKRFEDLRKFRPLKKDPQEGYQKPSTRSGQETSEPLLNRRTFGPKKKIGRPKKAIAQGDE